jgi:hypothetical protein
MLFMHTVLPPAGYDIVARRLTMRRPDYIVAANTLYLDLARALASLTETNRFTCGTRALATELTDARATIQVFFDFAPAITVCRRER